jgi:hypothetical protein
MVSYRIDIKKESGKLPVIYTLLKWVILIYVIVASAFLLNKLYSLVFRHIALSEWLAISLNLLLVIILIRQLLRLNEVKYLIVTDEHIKFRQRYPWTSCVKWKHIKEVQFGYSTVRFVTKNRKKYRFSLSKTNEDDLVKLYHALEEAAQKHSVPVLRPM